MLRILIIILVVLLPKNQLAAAEWSNQLGVETRYFFDEALGPQQHSTNLSLTFESEFYHDWNDEQQRLVFTPFIRLDQSDSERTHADLRELYWRHSFNETDLYIGIRKIFWGVTESLHLVDVINQYDAVENLDGEDKLGQPMVSMTYFSPLGDWALFIMPNFRERTFAGTEGRLRTPLAVEPSRTRYESSRKENHTDSALRWSHVMDEWDLGLSWFHGTDRTPQLITSSELGRMVLFPYYAQLNQLGIDLQYTHDAWLWKVESVARRHTNRFSPTLKRSNAVVGGFEYTLYGILSSRVDLGLIAEYQYDSRDGDTAPFSNNDVVVGGRLMLNDEDDSTLLALVSTDLDHRSRFITVEGSRRLNNDLTINLEARFFSNTAPAALLYPLRNDSYLEILLSHYF